MIPLFIKYTLLLCAALLFLAEEVVQYHVRGGRRCNYSTVSKFSRGSVC